MASWYIKQDDGSPPQSPGKEDMVKQVESLSLKFPSLKYETCEEAIELQLSEKQISVQAERDKEATDHMVEALVPNNGTNTLNIMLLGKTGAGKSKTGNLILGEDKFKVSSKAVSCTSTVTIEECTYNGVLIRVADTPGFIDTDRSDEDIATEILKVGMAFAEGIHIFLFVRNMTNCRLTSEERQAFQMMEEIFDTDVLKHSLFLLTRAGQIFRTKDLEEKTIDGYVRFSVSSEVTTDGACSLDIYQRVNNRVIGLENSPKASVYERELFRKRIISYLLHIVDQAPENQKAYTQEVFKNAQEKVAARKREKLQMIVSRYLLQKSYTSMKRTMKSEGDGEWAQEILQENPEEGLAEERVRESLKENILVLTDKSILGRLKGKARALFAAAGALLRKRR